MGGIGGFRLFGSGTKKVLSPEQQLNRDELGQEKVDEEVAKQDARYDAMTPEQRDEYYLHPGLLTRLKKALRGQ
jgi:hypothetical protein